MRVKQYVPHTCLTLAILLFLAVSAIFVLRTNHSVAEQPKADVLYELMERYTEEPRRFLEDYNQRRIPPEDAIALLIMMWIEQDGVFLPPEEIDPYLDYHYIQKGRHREMLEMKQSIYQRDMKGEPDKDKRR